jgi:hypothetical protein
LAGGVGLGWCFGAACPAMVEAEFSEHRIGAEIVALYGKLLDRGAKPV